MDGLTMELRRPTSGITMAGIIGDPWPSFFFWWDVMRQTWYPEFKLSDRCSEEASKSRTTLEPPLKSRCWAPRKELGHGKSPSNSAFQWDMLYHIQIGSNRDIQITLAKDHGQVSSCFKASHCDLANESELPRAVAICVTQSSTTLESTFE